MSPAAANGAARARVQCRRASIKPDRRIEIAAAACRRANPHQRLVTYRRGGQPALDRERIETAPLHGFAPGQHQRRERQQDGRRETGPATCHENVRRRPHLGPPGCGAREGPLPLSRPTAAARRRSYHWIRRLTASIFVCLPPIGWALPWAAPRTMQPNGESCVASRVARYQGSAAAPSVTAPCAAVPWVAVPSGARTRSACSIAASAASARSAIGAAGLRHVGPAAAALAAERLGAGPHQLDRVEPVGQILGHADDDRGLALGARHDRDDSGTDAPLQIVGQRCAIRGPGTSSTSRASKATSPIRFAAAAAWRAIAWRRRSRPSPEPGAPRPARVRAGDCRRSAATAGPAARKGWCAAPRRPAAADPLHRRR